ncbi:hypothetical protein [Moraxella bovis]|nr:hypothetical protein [Moraxella bovis]
MDKPKDKPRLKPACRHRPTANQTGWAVMMTVLVGATNTVAQIIGKV